MWYLQATPPILAKEVPAAYRQPTWGDDELITPFYRRMAMGGVHSVFLLMMIILRVMRRVLSTEPTLSNFTLLNTRSIRLGGRSFTLEHGVVYLCVDDVIAGHQCQDAADRCVVLIATALSEVGFVMANETEETLQKMVGVKPMRRPALLAPPELRLGDLYRAISFLEESTVVHPSVVHTVPSIYIWYGLLWRPSLAALFHIFRFVQTFVNCTDQMVPLWESVRVELRGCELSCVPSKVTLG